MASSEIRTGCNKASVKKRSFAQPYAARLDLTPHIFAEETMASEASEQMMALLSELATLKELNREFEANPNQHDPEEHRLRLQRHEEITQDIKALAEQKKRHRTLNPRLDVCVERTLPPAAFDVDFARTLECPKCVSRPWKSGALAACPERSRMGRVSRE